MPQPEKKPPHALLRRQPEAESPKIFAPAVPTSEAAIPYVQPKMEPASQILGDAGSSDALKALQMQAQLIRRADTLVLLQEALVRFKAGDWKGGGDCALEALHVDEKCGQTWHILGIARDKCGDIATALTCYETALRLMPDDVAIANDLGRLALRIGQTDMAEKFFRYFLARVPGHGEAINNLASTLREASRYEEAIDLLKPALAADPSNTQLWNVLGTVVNAQGDIATAAIFYGEGMKVDPNNVHAVYNYGNAVATLGDTREGLKHLLRALSMFTDAMHIHTCKLSIAFCYLTLGDYEQGWAWYEARTKDNTPERMNYIIPRPRWEKGSEVRGKHLFVSAEQGLGDEILFATILPDLIEEIGPEGSLSVGVEPRLVPVFRRAFPAATVQRHHTTKHKGAPVRVFPDVADWNAYDAWSIMGDFLGRYRRKEADFPKSNAFFRPDPERVAYWKAILNGLNGLPKVGILWKSLIKHSRRDRFYSPFEQWKDILSLDGIQFINLQYGDTTEEMAEAQAMGLNIWTPPGIDLKNDLDDLSALCMAIDCLLGPANATSNIAGAAGGRVWMVSPENSWNSLGTDYFPWYPTVRVFFSPSLTDWSQVMGEMRDALIDTFVRPGNAVHVA